MASIAHAIRSFQSGSLSRNEFFAQVDSALATDRTNSERLQKILDEEHTRILLPPDVYSELQQRVEHLMGSHQGFSGDETPMPTTPSNRQNAAPPTDGAYEQPGTEPERMKGVGDTLNGRFVLEECIGFGGMGTVYKALDLRKLEASDRKPYIAIKVLNVQFRGHPKSLIALQREAKKAQTLAHPNIVTVYDFDRDGSMVYLTMEYLSGKPLSKTVRAPDFEGMPYPQAIRIVGGIAKALSYAHERGFVHCDLKPANVFLTDKGEVKVIDFGIARVFQKPQEEVEATVFDPGSLGGLTPAYASPEMLEHRVPDPRDDIYALACITYELLTGRHPFGRVPATQARAAGIKPQRPEHLGLRQWRALKAALSFERDARTPTVARFMADMAEEQLPVKAIALAASGVAFAGLIAGVIVWYWQAPDDDRRAQPVAEAPPAAKPPAPAPKPPEPKLSMEAVTPLLSRVPCSALAASVQDNTLQVQGYFPKSYGEARLKNMLSAIPGVKTLNVDAQQVSDDKCKVFKIFAPYWTRHRQAGGTATIRARAPNAELVEGQPLIVDIKTPGHDSHVYVDYYALDGNVAHLVPNPRARANQAPPNYEAAIGGFGNWVISKPFGTELIVFVATPVPLFDKVRAVAEPGAEYLLAVEKQLTQVADKHGPERIAVDFVQITTRPR
ncbi:MAG: protein kinase domain-containing protein [Noviherbaspirillum sp.]